MDTVSFRKKSFDNDLLVDNLPFKNKLTSVKVTM